MTALMLNTRRLEKPWGRRDLAPLFDDQPANAVPVGEIWFTDPQGAPRELLVKYLFTSERLSVQVHPDDAAAQARGYAHGKDEAWVVLSAEPDSTIALGLKDRIDAKAVRAAALNGSIEQMLDVQTVKAGDVFYLPAGTIHAIGAGLRIVEIQQNLDVTYRFYDYGSARELHLDEAMDVADFGPYTPLSSRSCGDGRAILAENVAFVLERWTMTGHVAITPGDAAIWILPLAGEVSIDGRAARLGNVVIVDGPADLVIAAASTILVAYSGSRVIAALNGSGNPRDAQVGIAAVTG